MKTMLFLVTAILFSATPLVGQQIQVSKENKTIAINTSADASALADTAAVTIGFTSYGKDQDATYAGATVVSNAILNALMAAGVPRTAVASDSQHLSPIEPNSDEDKARYAQGLRFEFAQTWTVTVPAAEAANALHIAIINGANNSGSIQWSLRNDDALQAEAAGKALEHAREIAKKMAEGLGAHLGSLVYASNQAPPRGIFPALDYNGVLHTESAALSMRAKNLKPLAIAPERITKSATVYAVFAIE